VIELDGGDSHVRKDVFEEDSARQNELILQGWTILRFTWDDVTKRPGYVAATIRQMLEISSRNRSGVTWPAASP
jgi:very-short-patch-repair endonuclease